MTTLKKSMRRAGALGALFVVCASELAHGQGAAGSGPQPVSRGATGRATLTDKALLIGAGTAPVNFLSPAGLPGRCVVSDGTSWAASYCVVAGSVVGTAPVTVNVSGGAANVGLTIDSNFAVVSNALALASISSGRLIANCGATTAEPTGCTVSAYLDRAIGATNGMFQTRVAGSWAAATFGTGLAFSGSVLNLQPASAGAIGGVNSIAQVASQWVQYIGTDGLPHLAQPAFSNLSGSATCAQLPALFGNVTTAAGSCGTTIASAAVSYAMIQNVAAARLWGNPGGSPAAGSEISLGATLAFSGTALQTAAGSGDVAWSANSFATTIQPAAVSFAKFQNIAALSVFGNCTSAAAAGGNVGGVANQVLRVNGAGTSCGFGSIDLSQAAAVTGTLQAASSPAYAGGDVTSTAGSLVLTLGAGRVTNAMLAGSIAASKLIGTDISTVGTVTAGVWNATTIGAVRGGTGLSSFAQGDLLYASAANTLAALSKSAAATRYLSNTGASNAPAWAQVDLATGVAGNLPPGNLNSGSGASSTTFWRGDGQWATPTGSGNVSGPGSATNNGFAKFDGTTGTLLKNSAATINLSTEASGTLQAAQAPALTGDCTTAAGSLATTCTKINGVDQTTGWTAYTPTVASASNALTSASASGRYKTLGKTVFWKAIIDIVVNGTGGVALNLSLPLTAGFPATAVGREVANTGFMVSASTTGTTGLGNARVNFYDGAYPGSNGAQIIISGEYELP